MARKKIGYMFLILILVVSACAPGPRTPETPSDSLKALLAGLSNLPPEAFIEEAFQQMLLRRPETMTLVGLGDIYQMSNDKLDSYNLDDMLSMQALESALLAQAKSYDWADLPKEVDFNLRLLIWILEDWVAEHPTNGSGFPFSTKKVS